MSVSFFSLPESTEDFFGSNPTTLQRASARQVGRMLCHLRDRLAKQLSKEDKDLAMPTGWILQCLVANCPPHFFNQQDWNATITRVIKYLCHLAEGDRLEHFTQLDGTTPLFPNHHLFDEVDTYEFFNRMDKFLSS